MEVYLIVFVKLTLLYNILMTNKVNSKISLMTTILYNILMPNRSQITVKYFK